MKKIVPLKKIRKARTRDEFFKITKDFMGIGLTFNGYLYENGKSGQYEIDQQEKWYSEFKKAKENEKKYGQYNGLKVILDKTFGEIYCGGVAGSHYGQYKFEGYRSLKRLKKLYASVLSPHLQKIVHNYPHEAKG